MASRSCFEETGDTALDSRKPIIERIPLGRGISNTLLQRRNRGVTTALEGLGRFRAPCRQYAIRA